jgi:hypothetical protein
MRKLFVRIDGQLLTRTWLYCRNDHRKLMRYIRRRRFRHTATIRRTHLSTDSFREFNKLGPALKGSIQIVFLDE